MALETGTYIDDLNTANPVGATDPKSAGDDHLRLIKSVLKSTFPNATEAFYFEAVLSSKTGAYSVVVGNARSLVPCDASGGGFTVTLPAAATAGSGFVVTVIKTDSAATIVTIDGSGSETINGALTQTMIRQYDSMTLWSDGSNWHGQLSTEGQPLELTKSGAYTALLVDKGKQFRSTAAMTLTLTAAATLGDGWWMPVYAYSGLLTIDPDGSETINGATTLLVPPTKSGVLYCNGTSFFFHGLEVEGKGADVASATTTTLGLDGDGFDITGTTTIVGFTARWIGSRFYCQFDGVLTLTHGTNLVCPGAVDVVVAAGTIVEFVEFEAGKVRVLNVVNKPPAGEVVIQTVSHRTGAVNTGTTVIPSDDTLPQQSTEGDQYLTKEITPRYASSTLRFRVLLNLSTTDSTGRFVGALHKDSDEDALAVGATYYSNGNVVDQLSIEHEQSSGAASAQDFNVNAGSSDSAGTTTLNGASGSRLFGGVLYSVLEIQEVI